MLIHQSWLSKNYLSCSAAPAAIHIIVATQHEALSEEDLTRIPEQSSSSTQGLAMRCHLA